jgi:hypothetical protein
MEIDGKFFAVEIKLSSSAKPGDAYGISKFAEIAKEKFVGGIVVYAGNKTFKLNDRCHAIPFDAV